MLTWLRAMLGRTSGTAPREGVSAAHGEARYYRLHGSRRRREEIDANLPAIRGRAWVRTVWKKRPALQHRGGGQTVPYLGQEFDRTTIDLVADGWTCDHCEVCRWLLRETADEAHGVGYTDGAGWICEECHARFVAGDQSQ